MNYNTKITLSVAELAMMQDEFFILTKRNIIESTAALFNTQITTINEAFKNILAPYQQLLTSTPKITKGENYNGMPYVILDYPADFKKENIFAVRTMFWWGNFISVTLHISSKYKIAFEEIIFTNLKDSSAFFIAVGDDEWQHHFEENNYLLFEQLSSSQKESIAIKPFFKIALKYKLHQYNLMQQILPEAYNKIAKLLQA